MATVFADAHGSIRRVSAPQRSSGRRLRAVCRFRRGRRHPRADPAGQPPAPGSRRSPRRLPATVRRSAAGPACPATVAVARTPASTSGPSRPARRGLPPARIRSSWPGCCTSSPSRLLAADDVPQALDRLAVFAAGAVPGRAALLGHADQRGRAAQPAPPPARAAQALDDLQYAVGQGPGLEAARTRALVTAQDLPADARWPELADCARAAGRALGRGRSRWTCSAPRWAR